MNTDKADLFVVINRDNFPADSIVSIKNQLNACDDSKLDLINIIQFRDPKLALVISLLAGGLGADRFYIGDTGLGVLKLITCGGIGLWAIIDWLLIMGAARERNLRKLMSII